MFQRLSSPFFGANLVCLAVELILSRSLHSAFSWMSELSSEEKTAIKRSKVLFCDGYIFHELSPGLLISALEYAVEEGTLVFFDPGPRGQTLSAGTTEEQKAIRKVLRMSDYF